MCPYFKVVSDKKQPILKKKQNFCGFLKIFSKKNVGF